MLRELKKKNWSGFTNNPPLLAIYRSKPQSSSLLLIVAY
jgi:hypothetical protein